MRTPAVLALALAPCAFAAVNDTYLAGLAQALSNAGLTQLATAAAGINATTQGQTLLSELPNGNYTVFAPNNDAFNALPTNISGNASYLADVLSYHILPGNLSSFPTASYPNVTIARTLLNDSSLVTLEGNRSQVLAWSTVNGNVTVLNQATNVTVQSHLTYANLTIHVIDGVLAPPAALSTVLTTNNLTGVQGVIGGVPGLNELLTAAHGYTLFAPDDAAVAAAQSSLAAVESNATLLLTVLQNHVINGTSAYSPLLVGGQNYTTAAGEPLRVTTNSSGSYVSSGSVSAKITRSDVLTSNGVVHVIDAVLADLASDPSAASSAYQSATSVAAQTPTQTAPLSGSTSSGSSSSSGSGGKKSGAVVSARVDFAAVGVVAAVLAGALAVL